MLDARLDARHAGTSSVLWTAAAKARSFSGSLTPGLLFRSAGDVDGERLGDGDRGGDVCRRSARR